MSNKRVGAVLELAKQKQLQRYMTGSTIIATKGIVSDWNGILGDTAVTAAIFDRFLESAEVFTITGKSYRLTKKVGKE